MFNGRVEIYFHLLIYRHSELRTVLKKMKHFTVSTEGTEKVSTVDLTPYYTTFTGKRQKQD
jgi:hypothetical protein